MLKQNNKVSQKLTAKSILRLKENMFRVVSNHVRNILLPRVSTNLLINSPSIMHIPRASISKLPMDHHETDDEFFDRMECYFNRTDIDGWELRKGVNEMAGLDFVPEPRIVLAALCACRRCNDYACTTRLLEMVKFKCGDKVDEIWPYILRKVEPALVELGIETPQRMGYDVPELWLDDVFDMKYGEC